MGISRPIVTSVVGVVSDTRWGQVFQSPHAYCVVEIEEKDGGAQKKGIALLSELARLLETPPITIAALGELADSIASGGVVTLIILVPVGSTIYIVSRAQGKVYLKRDKTIAQLLSGIHALSGSVKEGDLFIAGSQSFVGAILDEEIVRMKETDDQKAIAEQMTELLRKKKDAFGAAALLIKMPQVTSVLESAPFVPTRRRKRDVLVGGAKSVGRRVLPSRARKSLRSVVDRIKKRRWSKRKIITVLIISLFLMSVGLGLRKEWLSRNNARFAGTLTEANHAFEEGLALMDLNPVKGRERLTHARNLLLPILSHDVRTNGGKSVNDLYDQVEASLNRAMQVRHQTPQLYYDMGLLKKGATASDIALFGNTIGILDAPGSTIFTLGADSKKGTIIGGGQSVCGATQISVYGDKVYVWTPQGIHAISLADQKVKSTIIPSSPDWGMITDMMAFGGNIYLLDTRKSRIWKYVATADILNPESQKFSDLFEYLNPDTLPDLSQATAMSIDGSVWLGTNNGEVTRFTTGKENRFTPQGHDTPLGSALVPYVHDEAKYVYILDKTQRRVVVYDKDGLYMSQYTWEEEIDPKQIVVSEVHKKIFLLASGKIYSLELE